MEEILKVAGSAAGIGGLALGVFLLLFQKLKLPSGTRKHLTLFMWLVWSICVIGIAAYILGIYWAEISKKEEHVTLVKQQKKFAFELHCGESSPGEGSTLAKLFNYAESNEGELVYADVSFYWGDCKCSGEEFHAHKLNLACDMNPEHWLVKKRPNSTCVASLGLAGENAGIATFCFPSHDTLPIKEGYKREITATHERVAGNFLVNYEFSLGAPHVTLLIPE